MDGVPMINTTAFSVGLKKAVEWYEQNGVGETYSHLALND
jgi:hypothetical protein